MNRSNFAMIPNLVDDAGLSVFAYRLYGHLRRVAGDEGACWKSVRTLAKVCKMSPASVMKARKELLRHELIECQARVNQYGGRDLIEIRIVDVWGENGENEQVQKMEQQVSNNAQQVPEMNLARAKSDTKEDSSNKIQIKTVGKKGKSSRADPRSSHPAIKAFREVTNRYPIRVLYGVIIEKLGENPDLSKLNSCYLEWCKRGYNSNASTWLTDWYENGIPAQFMKSRVPRESDYPPAVDDESSRQAAEMAVARAQKIGGP